MDSPRPAANHANVKKAVERKVRTVRERLTARWKRIMPALGVCLVMWAAGSRTLTGQGDGTSYAPIIRAIVREVALPELVLVSPRDRLRPILLSDVTLARCPDEVTAPCVSRGVHLEAQREAAKGTFPFELSAAFQTATAVKSTLDHFDDSGFTMATPAEVAASRSNPAILAISRPAVIENQALVYVQFARTYDWLIVLKRESGGWKVSTKILISIG